MAMYYPFNREDVFPSFFPNRLQDFLAAARTDLRLSLVSTTKVAVIPDADLGAASISVDGRWRFNDAAVERSHPGGAKGTYTVWAVALDNDVDNEPDPFTDHTDYAFDLRITNGTDPSGAGVEIFQKIGEIDWSGAAIEALRQTHGLVTGPMLGSGALASGAPSDIEWTRASNGGLIANFKEDSVGATELADNAVDSTAIVDLAVITAKVAALAITEGKLAENSVATSKIVALAVTTAKLAAESVTSEKLGLEAVTPATIQKLAVTTAKLAAESVTGEKVAPLAISEAKLATESVSTVKIKNLAVTAAKLGEEAVATVKIANLAVTAAKIAELAVTEAKIADGAVSSRKWKPTSGIIRSTAVLDVSGGSFVNLPGAIVSITPAVPSRLFVYTAFAFQCVGTGANVSGTISVDGVADGLHACGMGWGGSTAQEEITGLSEVYEVKLSAALHTIRLVAAGNAGSGFTETLALKSSAFWMLAAE